MLAGTAVVVGDSATVRHLITAALRPYGITVVAAESAREALTRCRETAPDVVVLDVDMPGLDEFQTLEALRLMAGLERVPVLFLTSRTTLSDVVRGLERGVHDYLRKPVDAGDVLARVSAALRTKRLEDGVTRLPAPAGAPVQRAVTAVPRPASPTPVAPAGSVTGDCAVVLVDVDQVAHVSERYGPQAVEEVLGVVGRRLASRLRATDTAQRWQSTQFLVVLPGTPLDGAMLVAERLRATISRTAIQISGVGLLDITVSCGVAVSTAGPTASVLRSADAALASAHAAGDNAVRSAA